MITIYHGTDIVSSRNAFMEKKQQEKEALLFDGEKLTPTELIQQAEGSLFGGDKKLFIENLLSRKKSKELSDLVSYLSVFPGDIYLWEGDDETKKVQSLFPKATSLPFKLPATLFSFLDSVKPHEGKRLVSLFHETIKTTEAELVFFMLIRQMRLLLALSDSASSIDETVRLAPWQRGKLQSQSRLFSQEELKRIYNDLYTIDVLQKTGQTSLSLTQNIDIFLLGI